MRYQNITTNQIVEVDDNDETFEGQARWRKLADAPTKDEVDADSGIDLLAEVGNTELLERVIEARTDARVAEIEEDEVQPLSEAAVSRVRSAVATELATSATDLATTIHDAVHQAEAAANAAAHAEHARAAEQAQIDADAKAKVARDEAEQKAREAHEAANAKPDKSWQNDEIKQWAKDHTIDLGSATTKQDMLDAIANSDSKQ